MWVCMRYLCTLAEKDQKIITELGVCFPKVTFHIFDPNKDHWFLNVQKLTKQPCIPDLIYCYIQGNSASYV